MHVLYTLKNQISVGGVPFLEIIGKRLVIQKPQIRTSLQQSIYTEVCTYWQFVRLVNSTGIKTT